MPDTLSRNATLIKRLRYLWTFELFDSFFLPAMALLMARTLQKQIGIFSIYGFVAVGWLLWGGTAYWWLKLKSVKSGAPIQSRHIHIFGRLKWVNWLLLAGGPVLLGISLATRRAAITEFDVIIGTLFYVLALLEQVNYYYYQLMYDCPSDLRYLRQHKKLKRSSLSRALGRLA